MSSRARKTDNVADAISQADFRHVMGHYATGVTIVTTVDESGKPHGLTVNSFSSLSLDPPLVLWSLRGNSASLPVFREAKHFAINILSSQQEQLSRDFAKPIDRFAAAEWDEGLEHLPLIRDSLGWVECALHSELPGGDHSLFVGRVLRARATKKAPLLYWRGAYFPSAD
jgi:flavin reductase (DIM6/NTAB) family NADH-FMN oxidoreductase RutF